MRGARNTHSDVPLGADAAITADSDRDSAIQISVADSIGCHIGHPRTRSPSRDVHVRGGAGAFEVRLQIATRRSSASIEVGREGATVLSRSANRALGDASMDLNKPDDPT